MTLLHHAGVCVADMDRSLRFYRDCLGLSVLADAVLKADLQDLLGVRTERVRTVFLGESQSRAAGIVELLDLGLSAIDQGAPQSGLPVRGVCLLSVQVDIDEALRRLDEADLGQRRRTMATPGGSAVTVVDPDGVLVELLPRGELAIMGS
ncbi:VOC family protein [Mycobacteroides abscessus]|uniref:VOC family protein n=2 Tax=Mycobacteroides abscessus TaxID=36809 RepID=UPI0009266B87|nr:VOC family protein [Mycobacteroides abscessus]MDO3333895.1 VOC family protein [Mycobacteroides abscessus subsp. bolletii]QSM86889.1 VOC family protein [Mycobacteroides abscessus subsp. bolletii]SIB89092.1 lactoylglutathione lyase-like lyase [Mycobacteroides abscessus subsp. bolletii]SKS88620.1 lactoylglutathione lyase-like lyase [Mycobacteroides abscessus subsp. bolletii]SKT11503.1 lactoylglutathione lyase-like lyase [Mycobacteroides abscessus subsp. bolletii]